MKQILHAVQAQEKCTVVGLDVEATSTSVTCDETESEQQPLEENMGMMN